MTKSELNSVVKEVLMKIPKRNTSSFYLAGVQWASIPIALMDDKDSVGSDYIIYAAISSFINKETGTAFPKQEKLAERAKKSRSYISKMLRHLVKIRWATRIKRGLGRSDIVILHSYKNQKFTKSELSEIEAEIDARIATFLKI